MEGGALAGAEMTGLGSLLMYGGSQAGWAGAGWMFIGGEIVWIGVDLFQGMNDARNADTP